MRRSPAVQRTAVHSCAPLRRTETVCFPCRAPCAAPGDEVSVSRQRQPAPADNVTSLSVRSRSSVLVSLSLSQRSDYVSLASFVVPRHGPQPRACAPAAEPHTMHLCHTRTKPKSKSPPVVAPTRAQIP